MGNGKYLKYIMIIAAVLLLTANKVYAKSAASNDLVNNAKEYDKQQITYTGEVIGDIMERGDHA